MKFSRPKDAGTRLKQNYIKLRETKLSQYNVTLPKGIVEAMNFSKGDVFRVYIENGHIVLKKEFIAPKGQILLAVHGIAAIPFNPMEVSGCYIHTLVFIKILLVLRSILK